MLPQVRKTVLSIRATSDREVCGFGLSYLTWSISPSVRGTYHWRCDNRSRYTSGALKTIRGHVQACLAILAREGIMYGRNHPEPGVERFAHGETDKRFRVRITQEDAKKRLSKMQ